VAHDGRKESTHARKFTRHVTGVGGWRIIGLISEGDGEKIIEVSNTSNLPTQKFFSKRRLCT
jgi:hypothetical protein